MTRKPYPSDLTNAPWRLIRPVLPPARGKGRPRKYDPREVLNGVLSVDSEGCRWRSPPHDLPHWETCHDFFRAFERGGTWAGLVATLRVAVRTHLGRDPTPSGACVDSQSAKTASGGADVGTDGGERVRGRKRHIATDTLGLLPAVVVAAANPDDGETAPRVRTELRAAESPRPSVVWADSKDRDHNPDAWLAEQGRLRVEATRKPDGQTGFEPLKTRWVVAQAFGCLVRSRRMTRDYERLTGTSAAMVQVACVHRMARRAKPPRGRRKFRYKRKPAAI